MANAPTVSSNDALALRDAVSRICSELCDNSVGPPDLWSAVIELIRPTIQASAQKYTVKHSPVARMPDELLCAIFAQLSLTDRIATSHVCHAWRDVSLQNVAQVWTHIPRLRTYRGLGELLQRSSACPVFIDLAVTSFTVDYITRLLTSHMSHIRGLTLELFVNPDLILRALRRPAPLLEHLVVTSDVDEPTPPIYSTLTFSSKAPKLRTVKIDGVQCDFRGPPKTLRNLRSFTYSIDNEIYDVSNLPIILMACSHAEEIAIKTLGWESVLLPIYGHKPYKPSNTLRRIVFRSSYGVPSALFDLFIHDSIPELKFDCPEEFEALWTSLRLQGPLSVEAHCDAATDLKIVDPKRNIQRVIYNIRHTFSTCPPSLLSCIKWLTLSTTGFDWGFETRSPLPELPGLLHLTLITRDQDSLTQYMPPGELLRCRALETMTLCPSISGIALPHADAIIQFVQNFLRIGRPSLHEIILVWPTGRPTTSTEYSAPLRCIADTVLFASESQYNIPNDVRWSLS